MVIFVILITVISCSENPYPQGKELYNSYCANCHMDSGEGLEDLMPPLKSSDYLKQFPNRVACMIRYGNEGTVVVNGKEYSGLMPANPELTATQITNIINYINNAWGNSFGFTQPDSVLSWLEECEEE